MKMTTEQIWHEFRNKLFQFILKRVNDREVANDILQEVFIKIHIKLDTLKDETLLTSWIYKIAANVVVDYYRNNNRPNSSLDQIEEVIEEGMKEVDLYQCLSPFIVQLDKKYKEAILAVDLGQQSQKQFAETTGLSYSGAKTRVQRAREQLKTLFNDCCTIVKDSYGNIIELKDCQKKCGCQEEF